MKLIQKIRIWIEDLLCRLMFKRDYANTVALMGVGRRYAKRLSEAQFECERCGSKWYPKVGGHSPYDGEAWYCPYCGKHR